MAQTDVIENESTQQLEEDGDTLINQYVTFQIGAESFGFPMRSVLEIIRPPRTVKAPLTPEALVGLANLRNSVLPVIDLRLVLSLPASAFDDATRVIVADIGVPVGLVVDRVLQVREVEEGAIENASRIQSSVDAQLLNGVIKGEANEALIQLLDVEQLLAQEFSTIIAATIDDISETSTSSSRSRREGEDDADQLVSFAVDGQEYAFDLMQVESIVRVPATVSRIPHSDRHVLGLMDLRGRLLPLVTLRGLLGLETTELSEDNRVLVVIMAREDGGVDSVGLVVDEVKEVLRVSKDVQDPVPSLIGNGEGDISCICRLDNGKRLVSVLQAHSLFNHAVVKAALAEGQQEEAMTEEESDRFADGDGDDDNVQLVVFQLGGQEYAVPIEAVQEITRIPEKMDRVPKTADFIEGMVNLRGAVLPVLSMRARFGMEKMERNDRERIMIINLSGVRTGFIVDSVSEVLRLTSDQIESAPHLSNEQARMMGEVVNLVNEKRMIQVLTARELLSEQEKHVIHEQLS